MQYITSNVPMPHNRQSNILRRPAGVVGALNNGAFDAERMSVVDAGVAACLSVLLCMPAGTSVGLSTCIHVPCTCTVNVNLSLLYTLCRTHKQLCSSVACSISSVRSALMQPPASWIVYVRPQAHPARTAFGPTPSLSSPLLLLRRR